MRRCFFQGLFFRVVTNFLLLAYSPEHVAVYFCFHKLREYKNLVFMTWKIWFYKARNQSLSQIPLDIVKLLNICSTKIWLDTHVRAFWNFWLSLWGERNMVEQSCTLSFRENYRENSICCYHASKNRQN